MTIHNGNYQCFVFVVFLMLCFAQSIQIQNRKSFSFLIFSFRRNVVSSFVVFLLLLPRCLLVLESLSRRGPPKKVKLLKTILQIAKSPTHSSLRRLRPNFIIYQSQRQCVSKPPHPRVPHFGVRVCFCCCSHTHTHRE